MIQDVTADLATAFKLSSAEGVLIGDVTADSPGAKAGLQKGDVVVAVNGQSVADAQDLRLRVSQMAPGSTVRLDVVRDAQRRQLTATLVEYPETVARAGGPNAPEPSEAGLEGLQVSTLTADIAQQLDLPATVRGVVVTNVDPNSSAADAQIQRGDVIQEVNRQPIANVQQFRAAIREAGNQPILLLVNRGGQTRFAVIAR
jgi:serine protease Do